MTTPSAVNTRPLLTLDKALRYAVIQSWNELMPHSPAGSIQIEYQNAASSELEYLKLWKSAELGHWGLIAEFWEKPLWGNAVGLRMGDEYLQSVGLIGNLDFVLSHQKDFASLAGTSGVLQIFAPTTAERQEAANWIHIPGGASVVRPMAPAVA